MKKILLCCAMALAIGLGAGDGLAAKKKKPATGSRPKMTAAESAALSDRARAFCRKRFGALGKFRIDWKYNRIYCWYE